MAGPSVNAIGNGRFWAFSGVGFGSVSDDMTSIPYMCFLLLSTILYLPLLIALFRQPNSEQTRSLRCLLLASFFVSR